MSPKNQDWSKWFIDMLKREIATFDDTTSALLENQSVSFFKWHELLQEDLEDANRSSSVRSLRLRARKFVKTIHRDLGPEVFILCVLAVSITKTGEIAKNVRIMELKTWWKTVQPPRGLVKITERICDENKITIMVSRSPEHPSSNTTLICDASPPKRPKIHHHDHSPIIEARQCSQGYFESVRQNNCRIPAYGSNFTAEQEPLMLVNASRSAIAKVFNEYICRSIRAVMIDHEWKAAVNMTFPGWVGPVQCLMSLEISKGDMAALAMDLFKAEIIWVDGVLHVILDNGMTMLAETGEVTLKGVKDEIIDKVFGSVIHSAIRACPVRQRETSQTTECVSMIFMEHQAIINLSLDIREGLRIGNELYPNKQ